MVRQRPAWRKRKPEQTQVSSARPDRGDRSMPSISRRTILLGPTAFALLAAPARAAAAVRVGSKLDTEAALLGTIILQLLNANGIPTVNRLRLGNTKIVRSAITSGEID